MRPGTETSIPSPYLGKATTRTFPSTHVHQPNYLECHHEHKEIQMAKRRGKRDREKWKFKLLFIDEKLCREKTKGRRKPRQAA